MPVLTRQELYDLVWSTPLTRLADDFGLSDVGLAKICERHRVPTPPRGYWAKKEAGKKVKQTIFIQVDDPLLNKVEIAASRDKLPEPVREIVEQRRAERKASLRPPRPATMTPPTVNPVEAPHPAIEATAKALRRGKPSSVVVAIGPGLCGISVGNDSVERVIAILDALARACDKRDITLSPADNRLSASVGHDSATFELKEKTKQVPHVLTEVEIREDEKRRKRSQSLTVRRLDWNDFETFPSPRPQFDTVRTGELSIEVHGWGQGLRRSWRDGKMQVLENLIDDIVGGLEAHIAAARMWREKREREETERGEFDRRRGLAKARRERESNRKALLSKLVRTERQAAQLRTWLASQEHNIAQTPDPGVARMMDWAREQLALLDAVLNPIRLADDLRTRKLFPETDELRDPLGEPPPERPWWQ